MYNVEKRGIIMEQIYTIPVNEAFEKGAGDESRGCPFCRLRDDLNRNEIELILGASMMEPDVRKQTNLQGFCRDHYGKLLAAGKRLPLALILESHLAEVDKMVKKPVLAPAMAGGGAAKKLGHMSDNCYICKKVDLYLSKMMDNAAMLWSTDMDFVTKCSKQSFFCIDHFAQFLAAGKAQLDRKTFADFYKSLYGKEEAALKKISEDVSFFAKKFDYRYENEPWEGRENAPETAIDFLCGKEEL